MRLVNDVHWLDMCVLCLLMTDCNIVASALKNYSTSVDKDNRLNSRTFHWQFQDLNSLNNCERQHLKLPLQECSHGFLITSNFANSSKSDQNGKEKQIA